MALILLPGGIAGLADRTRQRVESLAPLRKQPAGPARHHLFPVARWNFDMDRTLFVVLVPFNRVWCHRHVQATRIRKKIRVPSGANNVPR